MKINHNGQELETITEGYWPEGVTLVQHDGNITSREVRDAVCLRSCSVLRANGAVMTGWRFCAILTAKQEPRRLTNREVAGLCRKGWDRGDLINGGVTQIHEYLDINEKDQCANEIRLRAPNTDKWLEPTSDLLEVAK